MRFSDDEVLRSHDLFVCFYCSAFVAVFTNLGASGRFGPTSIGSHYRGKDHDGQVTLASGMQNWTVPISGEYQIEAIGASGGYDNRANSQQYRGRGARMIGTFTLIKGEIIQILVGQEGGINTASSTSGGGGGSFVVRGAAIPLIIAGGGGGVESVTSRHSQCDASTSTTGNTGYKSHAGGSGGSGAQASDGSYSGEILEIFQIGANNEKEKKRKSNYINNDNKRAKQNKN